MMSQPIALPHRPMLTANEAARHLGVARGTLLGLAILRIGPRAIPVNRRRHYRREELDRFRADLLQAVGVGDHDTPYRHRPAVPGPDTDTAPPRDPLLVLLTRQAIRRRLILTSLWGLLGAGGLASLILF
ncbi:hypothetical protein AA103196_2594 [Ameyamaea chiangmaiensis NBRC 103196]|uniref:Helix-turn-helix domain-containing protein n=1 Tax=Ameyamaea chiangmaiensis TaxID=442969 RepID=A0A850P6A8_9PROT|nr:hypothetical protein [Ameyamaea chiangmaiensis]MBS4075604.1 hypothetical protein [Ameyamaea chiangmaiensis]NVN40157.1 hypothetical protein [Ameyamaea chiangmaiensis]GBQ70791.1 hypothetical protein AA103196_2594 [Ameyamaea chiangmaiensis NBRC 103196]